MLRFAPIRAFKGLLALLIVVGCTTQEGIIDRPDWAKAPAVWDYTGVTFASFGSSPYKASPNEMAHMAEDKAVENLRRLMARELAKAYIKATKASISEDDAARQLENNIGTPLEKQHHYDDQRQVYFIQIFLPASRIEDIVNKTFGTKLKMKADGTLGK